MKPVTSEVTVPIRHDQMNVAILSVSPRPVNYKTLADGKPLPLTADQMKQIEDLTRSYFRVFLDKSRAIR